MTKRTIEQRRLSINTIERYAFDNQVSIRKAADHFRVSEGTYYLDKKILRDGVGYGAGKKKKKKKPAYKAPVTATVNNIVTIEQAIIEETNAFIQSLDDRIDKAMQAATQKILKHYKIAKS